jgi:SAM-dependent methyltransferase
LALPLRQRLKGGAHGLDFGCGPAPLLVKMMNEAGFRAVGYDPLFAPHESLLDERYDFVSCSEVVEHFRNPAEAWRLLVSLLKPGGVLGVMTEWYRGQTPLSSWRYARDPTHLVFYCRKTFEFLAETYGLGLEFPRENVCLLGRFG